MASFVENRESAYIYAVNGAASIYQIVKECSLFKSKNCSCSILAEYGLNKTGACYDHVTFAYQLSKAFLREKEQGLSESIGQDWNQSLYLQLEELKEQRERSWLNNHNSEVGRQVSA